MSRLVVALGGNALSVDGQASAAAQQAVAATTAKTLASLIAAGHELVIVHGNGPQVGNIILHEEGINTEKNPTMPIDTCVAMSQGQIGYWLQNALRQELRRQGLNTPVGSLITQVLVDPNDPAFSNPTKPIGPFYTEDEAKELANSRGFSIKEDAGRGWRRVVPSPQPLDIVETDLIKVALLQHSVLITAGGGGIPVYQQNDRLTGVEAVIDKDFAAAKLAELIEADTLLILTAIDCVKVNFREPNETSLHQVSSADLQIHLANQQFAAGSMLPKVQASLAFVKNSSHSSARAIITSIDHAFDALEGKNGTIITA